MAPKASSMAAGPASVEKRPVHSLLRRAHSPTTAKTIYNDKIQHKTLPLHTESVPIPQTADARERRRAAREVKLIAQGKRRRKRPQPLSAAEKRRKCIYDIPKAERKYSLYLGLHELWCAYMREILLGWAASPSTTSEEELARRRDKPVRIETQQAGAKLASADYHGARLVVVRSRCVDRVGVRGIVVRDTMGTFVLVTEKNEVKTVPKEGTVFRFEVPVDLERNGQDGEEKDVEMPDSGPADVAVMEKRKPLVFELHGEQFKVRAPDRTNKKFRWHPPDL